MIIDDDTHIEKGEEENTPKQRNWSEFETQGNVSLIEWRAREHNPR